MREAWEASCNGFDYSANHDPDYKQGEEVCAEVVETTEEEAEIGFEEVCGALALPYED